MHGDSPEQVPLKRALAHTKLRFPAQHTTQLLLPMLAATTFVLDAAPTGGSWGFLGWDGTKSF